MNITLLIGNGFDIAQGAKTRYADFYEVFRHVAPINDVERQMIGEISGPDTRTWADMERQLGRFTAGKRAEDYREFYYHLLGQLYAYFEKEEARCGLSENADYAADLWEPDRYLTPAQRQEFGRFLGNYTASDFHLSIISYNYTRLLEQTLGYKGSPLRLKNRFPAATFTIDAIHKIHGSLGGTPILGVNDASQLANVAFADDADMTDFLIKPSANALLGTLTDEACAAAIRRADWILLHGLSVGETDNCWWQLIGQRLVESPSTRLFYFYHSEQSLPALQATRMGSVVRRARQALFDRCEVAAEHREEVARRTYVIVNSGFLAPRAG